MIINGTEEARKIRKKLADFIAARGIRPQLAIIQVGNDEASCIYIRNKRKKAEEIGIMTEVVHLAATASTDEVVAAADLFNRDSRIAGIIVQMPLPPHIERDKVICAISPEKDVDGFHPENFGRLNLGMEGLVSCTPMGCLHLIKTVIPDISGMNAVVIGRSVIVGRPMALILLNNNASTTILHSCTRNIAEFTANADIVVSCTGRAGLLRAGMLKPDAVLIDVGITRLANGRIAGDSDFADLKDKIKAITPPIGGVGPMTVAMLLYNTVKACSRQEQIAGFEELCG